MTIPKRIQRSREKGYRLPEGAICVSRPNRFGNPFPVDVYGRDLALRLFKSTALGCWEPSILITEFHREELISQAYQEHQRWIKGIGGHPVETIRCELRGKDLACWCNLLVPCHADVLLEIANG